ncbi:MAG: type II toxin-antitoxin system HicB family antitoxin [Candidatus Aenigmarchaeota archaeon]|nr:type II toxin-antitoxin system HicB family antitoxin [Candidatus Aenigmarchaeota archaeon]
MKKEKISGLTAVYRKVKEGYIAYVEEIPGVNTQGSDLKETKENLLDALRLVLEVNREMAEKDIEGHNVLKEKISIDL